MSPSPVPSMPRRRFLRIAAATGAALLVAGAAPDAPVIRWRGYALGAEASLTIRTADRAQAERAIAAIVAEIDRLEGLFSLYRPASALAILNRAGALDHPPTDLVDVFDVARVIHAASGGAFDPTVQPLWPVYVRAERHGSLFAEDLEAATALIGFSDLTVSPSRIAFARPGMAATLNGIAQGFATDRVAGLLRAHGFANVLIDLGEYAALGQRRPGQPWRVGVPWPEGLAPARTGMATVLALRDRAVATSSPFATPLSADAGRHHLFDPATGLSARSWAGVSVVAGTAMLADALSTAIAVAPEAAADAILAAGGGIEAILIDRAGRLVRLGG